jgi:hypothetical protein
VDFKGPATLHPARRVSFPHDRHLQPRGMSLLEDVRTFLAETRCLEPSRLRSFAIRLHLAQLVLAGALLP